MLLSKLKESVAACRVIYEGKVWERDIFTLVCDSREDCNAIIETATNQMVTGSATAFIPNSVTSLSDYHKRDYRHLFLPYTEDGFHPRL